jgi:hypothetical protein
MHDGLETIFSCGLRVLRRTGSQTQNSWMITRSNIEPRSIRRQ